MELITPTALQHFGAAIAYSLLGITLFFACFVVIDKLTPGDMWGQIIHEKNTAVAILFGCAAIGVGIVIAAAIAS
jgi:putative membrane protein